MSVLSLVRYVLANRFRWQRREGVGLTGEFIDVHAHYLPSFYLDAMKNAGLSDIDGWPVPDWSAQRALAMMDDCNIAAQILSISSPGVTFAKGQEARDLSRALNTYIAAVISDNAPRFGAFAVVPLPDVEGSLNEIAYALDTLDLEGVGLLSNYGGVYLGDERLDPIFEELNRRKAVVFVHPTPPPNFNSLGVGLPAPIMEYPFDSTRMASSLIKTGTLNRYPDIRFIISHGGGTIPYLYPRLVTGLGKESGGQFSTLYYDLTATTAPVQMAAIQAIASSKQFLMGFDFPFMNVKMAGPAIAALHLSNFSVSQMRGIQHGNAGLLFPKISKQLQRTALS